MSEQAKAFVEPARARSGWLQVIGTLVVTTVIIGAVMIGIFTAVETTMPERAPEVLAGGTPFGVMVFLVTFAGFHIGLWLALRMIHRRGYGTLFGPPGNRVRNFGYGVAFAAGLVFIPFVFAPLDAVLFPGEFSPPRFVGDISVWVVWLVPALIAVLIQTSAEEVLFRGYLLQQLAARASSMWVWAVLPSAIFAVLHYNPGTFGVNTWFHIGNTLIIGVLLALVTMRTGNLGAAIGLHFANNAIGFLLFGIRGFEDGLALFVYEFDLKGSYVTYGLIVQTVVSVLGYLLWSAWMNRRARRLQSA